MASQGRNKSSFLSGKKPVNNRVSESMRTFTIFGAVGWAAFRRTQQRREHGRARFAMEKFCTHLYGLYRFRQGLPTFVRSLQFSRDVMTDKK
jgi:hypothetical protein